MSQKRKIDQILSTAPTGNHAILRKEIFKLSKEKENWEIATKEWYLHRVSKSESGNCICTHDIAYDFWIRNKENGAETHVGSDCINHFTGNGELISGAILSLKNFKRKRNGEEELGPCIVCGKNTSFLYKHHRSKFCHKSCAKKLKSKERKDEFESNKKDLEDMLTRIGEFNHDTLTSWEQGFLNSITAQKSRGMSEKQSKVLEKILDKISK